MYILDTNVFYDFADPCRVDPETLAQVQQRAEDGLFSVAYTPITAIELVSRIKDQPEYFDIVKKGIQSVLDMRAVCLPGPELRMAEIIADNHIQHSMYKSWAEMMYTIARATDRASLIKGFDDFTTLTRRQMLEEWMSSFREDYEKSYIDTLLRVAKQINPKYEKQLQKKKTTKISRPEQDALNQFLNSSKWESEVLAVIAHRSKIPLPTDRAALCIVLHKIKYFKQGYENLIRRVFCDGYQPDMKKKNDYNDMHLFLYLDDFYPHVLVTSETQLKEWVDNSQRKIINMAEFIAETMA